MKGCAKLALAGVLLAGPALCSGLPAGGADSGSPFSQSKFVPDISLILDFSYSHGNRGGAPSFPDFARRPSPAAEGSGLKTSSRFDLNYGEVTFFSVVDPYFDLFAVCQFTSGQAGLEEAYLATRGLPLGLQVRAGKFLSGFGRMNEQHEHYWDFIGAPLPLSVFLGDGLNEKGVRLTWVAPVDFYLTVGCELLEGENKASFGRAGFEDALGGVRVAGSRHPNLAVGYLKGSFDVSDWVVLGGLSGASGRSRANRGLDDVSPYGEADEAESRLYGGSLTLKRLIDSFRYVSLQSEVLLRNMNGTRYERRADGPIRRVSLGREQSGWYAHLVAKWAKRWRAGLRHETLDVNRVRLGGAAAAAARPWRACGMIEFNPTEFSRLRLQFNLDRSLFTETAAGLRRERVHELILQANLAIGAHGAHSF
jgi:hypothetical protein